jgi:CO/xanthine dehydrogenase FAD-binding subunit
MTEFYTPKTVKEAVGLLSVHPELTILAGGTDIVVARRAGRTEPSGYLNIMEIEEMKQVRVDDGVLFIGAAVTFEHGKDDPVIKENCPVLCEAAASVGSPQIRCRGTFGGNVMNASPAADTVPVLTALGAKAVLESSAGSRSILVDELITGNEKTCAKPGELLIGFLVPLWSKEKNWCFQKIGRRNSLAISRMNGVCVMDIKGNIISEVRLCIGASTNRPMRFKEAEEILTGKEISDELFKKAGISVREKILAETGIRASSGYKLPVAEDFTVRILKNTADMQ